MNQDMRVSVLHHSTGHTPINFFYGARKNWGGGGGGGGQGAHNGHVSVRFSFCPGVCPSVQILSMTFL